MKIGQLCLFRLSSPAEHPYGSAKYGSRYQGQRGPTPSKSFLNFHRTDISHDLSTWPAGGLRRPRDLVAVGGAITPVSASRRSRLSERLTSVQVADPGDLQALAGVALAA